MHFSPRCGLLGRKCPLKVLLFCACLIASVDAVGQIGSPTASYQQPTQYTNGMPNDQIFVFCSPDIDGNPILGSLTATPTIAGPGFNFQWGLYNETTHAYTTFQTQNGVPSSTVSNLATGGYKVTITNSAGQTQSFITWVYVSELAVGIDIALDPTNPGCEPFQVNGTINATGFTYWDPVDPGAAPFIVDANTTITVCFNANHTYVSDIGFVLIGPPSCGSPGVTLSPNPFAIATANGCCCNSGNNLNNLCFSTSNSNQLNMCGAGTPLTGTYGFYNGNFGGTGGANYPQGGLAGLYGCNAAEGGWAVQIYDCIGADVGSLTGASIVFSDGTSTINYNSGPINSAINDNSCTPATASIYVVPLTTPVNPTPQQVPNTGTLSYQLGVNGVPVTLAPGTTTFTQNINPIPTYDEWYYLEITDNFGCRAIDSVMFDFTGYADATIDPVNATNQLCTGNAPVQLTAVTAGGTWTGTGVNATGVFDPALAGVGVHTITYTIADPCGDVATIDITVSDMTFDVTATASICTAHNGTATVTPTSGTPPYDYVWATSPPQTGATATGLAAGDYQVAVSAADGCSLSALVTVPFDASDLSVSVVGTQSISCYGLCDGTATSAAQNGTAPYIYLWDDASAQTTAVASGLCVGPYNVQVTDANGCVANAQTVIIEPTALTANASMTDQSDCGQPNGAATVVANGGVVAGSYGYVWNSIPAQSTMNATGLLPGDYEVVVSDDNGCSVTAAVTITTTPGFSASIVSATDALCNGSCTGTAAAEPSATGTAPFTYVWNTSPSQSGPSASGLCAGSYSVTITDVLGCEATATVAISEPLPVVANASVDQALICIGGAAQLTAAASGGTQPYASYQWTAHPADGSLTPGQQNQTVTPTSLSTNYSLVVTDANGCQSMSSVVTVQLRQPLSLQIVRPIAGADTSICAGDSAVFNLTASGGDGYYTYALLPDPAALSLPLTVSPTSTTTYNFQVTDGCTTPPASASATVTVNPLPTILFSVDDPDGCDPHTAVFNDMSTPQAQQWLWNFGDPQSTANTATQSGVYHTFSGTGVYDISLQTTSLDGCTNDTTFTQFVEVYPLPQANFTADPTITNLVAATIRFTDQSTGTIDHWSWDFGDGATGVEQHPIHAYQDTGLFVVTLIVTTDEGCVDLVRNSIEVEPDFMFYIPNTFTPDSDGKNDVFRPYGDGVKWESFEMTIYNRWGEQIFYTRDVAAGWDGRYKGADVEVGVYVYVITIQDTESELHSYRGNLNVVR
jgi:gliding motility-associated-like protein